VDATFKAELRKQHDRNLALSDAKREQRLPELEADTPRHDRRKTPMSVRRAGVSGNAPFLLWD
jgi:hypothetical protein